MSNFLPILPLQTSESIEIKHSEKVKTVQLPVAFWDWYQSSNLTLSKKAPKTPNYSFNK